MAYYSQQNAATASMAPITMSWIDTSMISAGWTFVESVGAGGSGSIANVYKSAASANSINMDFYVATYRATASSTINFRLFEQWDSTNKLALKYAPAPSRASGFTVSAIDQTISDSTGLALNSTGLNPNVALAHTTTITQYYADITTDRVIIGCTNQGITIAPVYAGIYDTLCKPADDTKPLVLANFKGAGTPVQADGTSGQGGASTREPTTPSGSSAGNFQVQLNGPTTNQTSSQLYSYVIGNNNDTNLTGSLYRGAATSTAARIMFSSGRTVTVGTFAAGSNNRGVFKDVITAPQATLSQGDTLAVTDDSGSVRNYICALAAANAGHGLVFIRTS
jgi:hypothetical protein